ncbi:MAG TPA: peptidoglycan DD-metalloendopeptidase family protein [Pseudolabrys sp.]|nr:peptidoglycan DD-metalloendopeptidase family protein [Pseudolabrys sp.]
MKRSFLVGVALLIAGCASAEEMKSPRISVAHVDWQAAAASLADSSAGSPAETFVNLNAAAGISFPGIGDSSVPVLLPYDVQGFIKYRTEHPESPPDQAVETADNFMRAGFQATRFFVTGPAGYDAAFALNLTDIPELSDIHYTDPVYVLFSGLRMIYELDGPPLPEGEPVKPLESDYPGIRRYLHESYIRYSFQRYGVTYVGAIYCRDARPRGRILTCKQADRVMDRFLRALKLTGGTPSPAKDSADALDLERPKDVSKDFTYFSPGFLIPNTGLKRDIGGRDDYTVYARLRFPLKEAPAFANSQSFNNWGDCDFTGRSVRRPRTKDQAYSCNVNGRPLVFDEAAPANYSYPWRDNFCEHRHFFVGQCPGGEGHQGQDIRPSSCTILNDGADRCQPYEHEVVAAHDGFILRARKQEAVYLFINTPGTHVRVRYMHMNPNQLDADGILSGKHVRAGDPIGRVGNYNNAERGTTYHLHFDMQVPTKVGWVFVNPYMTLVSAYERLIGARGTEIKDGDPVPQTVGVPPVILHPSDTPASTTAPAAHVEDSAATRVKPHKAAAKARKVPRQTHRKRKHAGN